MAENPKNPSKCGSQNAKAKSPRAQFIAKLARFVRKAGLSYNDWRYVARQVRRKCDLHPAAKPKRLPRVLTADQFRAFYKAVDQADDIQHALMLRLLFFTAVRVSELCGIEVADIDLENCKIRINQGKGSKDRFVLFGRGFAMSLRTHIAAHPQNRYLFQTRRCGKFSTRRVEQIVKKYAEQAGIQATPHVFRHQCITFLTKNSGMADAELQLITGHAKRETLSIYQHVCVDGAMADKYQAAMKDVDL